MMFSKNNPVFIPILFIIFLLFTTPSYSIEISHTSPSSDSQAGIHPADSENNENTHTTDRSGDLRDLLYRYMNFTVLVTILVIVFKKARIIEYFSMRSEEIRKRLEDIQRDRDDVENKFKEAEESLKKIEEKSREIIEQSRKEGMTEKERIISGAKEHVRQIIEQAEITIQKEIESARSALKHNIIEIASQKAQSILAEEIGDKEQANMVDDFIEKIGRMK